MSNTFVAVAVGSDSDRPLMGECVTTLQQYRVQCIYDTVSAHRTPYKMLAYADQVEKLGVRIIIAGAGGAAHLPGMIASTTTLPVIGVPLMKEKHPVPLDSLLSIAQMPPGVPVGTMAVNGAKNAALYAIRILAMTDEGLRKKLKDGKGL